MGFDALCVDSRALRDAPWRLRPAVDVLAPERPLLAKMLRVLQNFRPERRLIRQSAGMAVKIGPTPFGEWARNAPARREILTTVASRQHGEGTVTDTGDRETLGRSPELDLWIRRNRIGRGVAIEGAFHAALPSTIAAPTSSAVTSWSTARG